MRAPHFRSLLNIFAFFAVFAVFAHAAGADTVLVSYGFDGTLPTAQQGFFLFENSRGFVEPTDSVKFSGYRSLELQEAPLDHDFVELQGIVAPIESGAVLFHFAILVRNPEEELNVAVAGPAHFVMQADGIAFWLKSLDGILFAHTDSLPKRLFRIQKDTWYVVDAVLHVAEGTYDLRILESGVATPVVLLKNQPNATHSPGSKLSKISFIGDLEDRSSVHYFVDDVELRLLSRNLDLGVIAGPPRNTTNRPATPRDAERRFIEAGLPSSPAKNYFDEYLEVKQLEFSHPDCLPATSLRDFGIGRETLTGDAAAREEIRRAIHLKEEEVAQAPPFTSAAAQSILLWRLGCRALAGGNAGNALQIINESLTLGPDSSIARAALVMVLSTQRKRLDAERELLALYPRWSKDARLAVLVGIVSAAWSNYDEAREALAGLAEQITEPDAPRFIGHLLSGDHRGFDDLKTAFGKDWRNALDDLFIAQTYFYALLFTSRYGEAAAFAVKLTGRYAAVPAAARSWREREGDALFLAGKRDDARQRYAAVIKECGACETAKDKLVALTGRAP